jgi:hypothetical protein
VPDENAETDELGVDDGDDAALEDADGERETAPECDADFDTLTDRVAIEALTREETDGEDDTPNEAESAIDRVGRTLLALAEPLTVKAGLSEDLGVADETRAGDGLAIAEDCAAVLFDADGDIDGTIDRDCVIDCVRLLTREKETREDPEGLIDILAEADIDGIIVAVTDVKEERDALLIVEGVGDTLDDPLIDKDVDGVADALDDPLIVTDVEGVGDALDDPLIVTDVEGVSDALDDPLIVTDADTVLVVLAEGLVAVDADALTHAEREALSETLPLLYALLLTLALESRLELLERVALTDAD